MLLSSQLTSNPIMKGHVKEEGKNMKFFQRKTALEKNYFAYQKNNNKKSE